MIRRYLLWGELEGRRKEGRGRGWERVGECEGDWVEIEGSVGGG